MAETTGKKKKIYKLATELNISHEVIIEFLRKKGHEVKSHMSSVDEDAMREILMHFKKEKDVAERHQRKIAEIRESKKKREEDEAAEAVAVEEASAAVESAPAAQEAVEAQHPEPTPPSPSSPEEAEASEESPPLELVATAKPDASRIILPSDEEPVATEDENEPGYLTPLEKERKTKVGLTIKGKIVLTKPAAKKSAAPATTTLVDDSDEAHKKKKKKKKVRSDDITDRSADADDGEKKKKKKKRLRHKEVDQNEVKDAIRRTFAAMDDVPVGSRASHRKRKRKEREEEVARQEEEAKLDVGKLRVTEFLSVNDLANLMGVNVADVIKKCMELGIMVSINQRLDKDTITLVADEFGFQISFYTEITEDDFLEDVEDPAETLVRRAPVVTIMGHVDHGKTSLLDYIRRENVVAGEAGGITQHIGAYEVTTQSGSRIAFLDTPGHEAFTAMRARGAQITDIVVLVVAADDNVMPQTLEAISHAQAAGVPIIIAMNKIDRPDAAPDRIRQQLSEKNVLVEEWGGKYQSVELSARSGKGVDVLLEKIAVEAEVLDLKANPKRMARGTVVEAQLDKGKGVTATVLVQKGTLRVGDPFIAGIYSGKVRAMFDERGKRVEAAGPSTPVQLTGLDGFPQAGDKFIVTETDREAREVSVKRQQLKREQDFRQIRFRTLDDISMQIKEGEVQELAIIVKGDVDGSVEALADSLMKISHKEVKLKVVHSGVGTISESDIMLAAASGAVIIGFRVRPNLNARRLAEKESVDIRTYNIIYDAIEDVHKALEGLLAPEKKEEIVATIEIREVFKVPKIGNIGGCYVLDGKIQRNNRVRLIRDGIQVFEGTISSLKRFKDDVREVDSGFECGIGLENFNDIKVGDTIEAFKITEAKRKLA